MVCLLSDVTQYFSRLTVFDSRTHIITIYIYTLSNRLHWHFNFNKTMKMIAHNHNRIYKTCIYLIVSNKSMPIYT